MIGHLTVLLHNHTNRVNSTAIALKVLGHAKAILLIRRNAIITNHRCGEHDNLTLIRRIGQALWITYHPSSKHYLTSHAPFIAKRVASKALPTVQDELCR